MLEFPIKYTPIQPNWTKITVKPHFIRFSIGTFNSHTITRFNYFQFLYFSLSFNLFHLQPFSSFSASSFPPSVCGPTKRVYICVYYTKQQTNVHIVSNGWQQRRKKQQKQHKFICCTLNTLNSLNEPVWNKDVYCIQIQPKID